MFDTICTLPLPSDLFAQALHPTLPLLTVGLSSGHVQTYRLPADIDDADQRSLSSSSLSPPPPAATKAHILFNGTAAAVPAPIISSIRRSSSASENGLGSIDSLWKTRRHKGACRALTFNHDGTLCYSAGTDGFVKVFDTETGRVVGKMVIPSPSSSSKNVKVDNKETGKVLVDSPTVLHALSPQALILGTDSGKLYLQDLRQDGREVVNRASQRWTPHDKEHVNALVPLPVSETSTSGFAKQWASVGGTTLAVTDLRKGVVATSEDQEVELTSVVVVQGLKRGGTSVGEKVLVGQGDGVVSLWEKGVWGDLDERIVLDREGMGIDSLVEVPLGFGKGRLKMNEKIVAAGLEDGRVRFMRIGRNTVLSEWDLRHDEIDGVVALDFDVAGRLVSGGGQTVKVWTEAKGLPGGRRNSGGSGVGVGIGVPAKHELDSDNEDGDLDNINNHENEFDSDDSEEEEEQEKPRRKKRKRNNGKEKSGGKVLNFSGSF